MGRQRSLYIVVICALVMAGLAVAATLAWNYYNRPQANDVEVGSNSDAGAYRHILYNNQKYEYNNRITTIALIGLDSTDDISVNTAYGNAPRSDVLEVLVIDEYHNSATILGIDRNTMTPVQQYDLSGSKIGQAVRQISYAFALGEGKEVSGSNTTDAISALLSGIPVNYYVAMTRAAIPYINQMTGPVQVTVPNDDLVSQYPELTAGTVLSLDDEQAEAFIHYRDVEQSASNEGRMQRQRAYIKGFMDRVAGLSAKEQQSLWSDMLDDDISSCILTDIARNKYIGLSNSLANVDLASITYTSIDGQTDTSGELEQFIPDQDKLTAQIISIFYLPE